MASLPKIGVPPHPSDFQAVAAYMRPIVNEYIEGHAWIHLIDPTQTAEPDLVFNGAGPWNPTMFPVWSGWARAQPIRNNTSVWRATNPTTTRVVQFWIQDPDSLALDVRPGLRIAVDPRSPDMNDPLLSLYQFVTLGGINSSQAWQRTIDTQVDLEGRPNFDFGIWPEPPAVTP